jgi:hypothetical protein
MIKLEIVRTSLLSKLIRLSTRNEHVDVYIETISADNKREQFISLVSEIDTYIAVYTGMLSLPPDLENISTLVTELKSDFQTFGENIYNEILLALKIINKIKGEVEADDRFDINEDINIDLFQLASLRKAVSHRYFFYHDSLVLENSLILFDLRTIENLIEFLETESIPVELLFQLLAKLGTNTPFIPLEQYLLIKSGLSEKTMEAFLRLHLVKKGHYFHFPQDYSGTLNVHRERRIYPERKYQQFSDLLLIISEYNFQNDVLDKYLRLYQIVENLMFRAPLVQLERSNAGMPFSIRDFQRIYKEVNVSEIGALKKLMRYIFKENFDSVPTSFGDYILSEWRNQCPGIVTEENMNRLIQIMRIVNNNGDSIEYATITNRQTLISVFSQLIYSYRNSIVHNKDTELHLTHENLINHPALGNSVQLVLENFLIPCLEQIVFYLIIEENNIVRYRQSELLLWIDDNP